MQGFETVESVFRELIETNYPEVFVVEIALTRGPRSVLSVFIDTDEGINIDICARLSRKFSAWLEENDPFDFPFDLEVSSPDLGRPFKVTRQYHKNVGRKLKVRTNEEKIVKGVLESVNENGIILLLTPLKKAKKAETLENTHISLAFDAIQEAKVEISFD